ncbi:uncharacterized protein [Triticum aestivum]|nr:uncharacterized protein LOC123091909 isoform X2 [Triticum aestivum]
MLPLASTALRACSTCLPQRHRQTSLDAVVRTAAPPSRNAPPATIQRRVVLQTRPVDAPSSCLLHAKRQTVSLLPVRPGQNDVPLVAIFLSSCATIGGVQKIRTRTFPKNSVSFLSNLCRMFTEKVWILTRLFSRIFFDLDIEKENEENDHHLICLDLL